jgi:hypothetical protein
MKIIINILLVMTMVMMVVNVIMIRLRMMETIKSDNADYNINN